MVPETASGEERRRMSQSSGAARVQQAAGLIVYAGYLYFRNRLDPQAWRKVAGSGRMLLLPPQNDTSFRQPTRRSRVRPPLNNSLIESTGSFRPMMRLALPVLVEQTLSLLVFFSDTTLAGQFLEQRHLTAMTLVAYLMWFVPNIFMLVAVGSTAVVARCIGAGDRQTAAHATNQSLMLGAVLAAIAMICVYLGIRPLTTAMGLDQPDVAPLIDQYMTIVVIAIPGIMLTQIGPACLRGAGDMKSGMFAMTVVNIINVALGWAFIKGWFGLPVLGWQGLAIATAVGHWVGGLIILVLLFRGRAGLKLTRAHLRFDRQMCRRILRIGIPGGGDVITVILCHLWFLSIVTRLGDVPAAAHGVAIRIEALAYLPGHAFQMAAATLAGQYLGARDYHRAGRSVTLALLVGGSIMCIAGLAFFFAGEYLVLIMVEPSKSGVIEVATGLLQIVAVAMPALAVSMILAGALRGAGDTRWPLLFTLIGLLGVRIPFAYWLAAESMFGIEGAWYAMVADVWVRCLLIGYRFVHGGWKMIEV